MLFIENVFNCLSITTFTVIFGVFGLPVVFGSAIIVRFPLENSANVRRKNAVFCVKRISALRHTDSLDGGSIRALPGTEKD